MASEKRPLRVLHGVTGAAGQPWIISRAQRRLGLEADCVSVSDSKYAYGYDVALDPGSDPQRAYSQFLAEAIPRYDVFHFYFRPFFFFDSRKLFFPTGLDLLLLRAAGKVVIVHYRGSEVRSPTKFKELSPYHYVDENPQNLVSKFPEATVEALKRYIRGVSHDILVPDPELQGYVEGSEIVARGICLAEWAAVGVPDEDEPLVVHAPSRRAVKGTDAVMQAVETLRAEGLRFRFQLVEGLPNHEAREVYRRASIVVDQLRIGWYGVLSVEAMALGKAVLAYVRDDLAHHLPEPRPLAIANPDTVTDVLRRLIADKPARIALGERARRYCEAVHDADKIAAELAQRYQRCLESGASIDAGACLDYLLVQRDHTRGLYKKLVPPTDAGSSAFWKYLNLVEQEGVVSASVQAARKVASALRDKISSRWSVL